MVTESMTISHTYYDFKVITFMTMGRYNYDHMIIISMTMVTIIMIYDIHNFI